MWCKNIAGRFFGLVKKHARDRRTDRQNYDSQDRASIAASRRKNALLASILYWALYSFRSLFLVTAEHTKNLSPTCYLL